MQSGPGPAAWGTRCLRGRPVPAERRGGAARVQDGADACGLPAPCGHPAPGPGARAGLGRPPDALCHTAVRRMWLRPRGGCGAEPAEAERGARGASGGGVRSALEAQSSFLRRKRRSEAADGTSSPVYSARGFRKWPFGEY